MSSGMPPSGGGGGGSSGGGPSINAGTFAVNFAAVGLDNLQAAFGQMAANATQMAAQINAATQSAGAAMAELAQAAARAAQALGPQTGRLDETAEAARRAGEAHRAMAAQMGPGLLDAQKQMAAFAFQLQGSMANVVLPSLKESANAGASLSITLLGLTGSLSALTYAGIANSAYAQQFAFQYTEISRQLASAFVPALESTNNWLASVTGWFRSLSGSAQGGIQTIGILLVTFTGVALILPRIISGFEALTTVVKGLQTAMAMGSLLNPWILLAGALTGLIVTAGMFSQGGQLGKSGLNAVGAAGESAWKGMQATGQALGMLGDRINEGIQALARMGTAGQGRPGESAMEQFYREWRSGERTAWLTESGPIKSLGNELGRIGKEWTTASGWLSSAAGIFTSQPDAFFNYSKKDRTEAGGALGGMESIEATYSRIAQASRRVGVGGKDTQEKLLDTAEKILEAVLKGATEAGLKRPNVGP